MTQTKKRIKNDAYYTPAAALTKILLKHVDIAGTVCEPCVGKGHIAYTLTEHGLDVVSADIDINNDYPSLLGYDATKQSSWSEVITLSTQPDWTITNPPYRQPDCQKIIENAWRFSKTGIAMFLRLSYLEPTNGQAEFLKNNALSHLIIVNPRPQFRTDTKSTDSCTSAWFVWQHDWQDNTQIIYETEWR